MICPACGESNREDARFCRSCGKSLVEPPAAEIEPSVEAVETTLGEPEFGTETDQPLIEESLPAPQAETSASEEVEIEPDAQAEGTDQTEAEVKPESKETAGEGREGPHEPQPPAQEDTGEVEKGVKAEPVPEPEGQVVSFWREEAEPLEPEEPGTVIAGRYLLVEALDVQDDEILYLARDLQRCWQCGFENNAPAEAFCARCGASLERKPEAHLVQVRDAEADLSIGGTVSARLEHEGLHFVLLAEGETSVQPEGTAQSQSLRFLVGQRSDVGQLRELDEDSLLALTLVPTYESQTGPVMGLFAVADGMGGHEGGEVASKLALQVLAQHVLKDIILPEFSGETVLDDSVVARLRKATMAANDAVYLARQKAGNDMGTTLTAGYVRNDHLFLAHVGDCRAYRWNAKGLQHLTTDHSVIASMIDSGQAAPEEIYTHPHRSVIYRSIGDKPAVEVDTPVLPLVAGDRLIFCCDGLWEMIRDEGIADVMMQEADPQVACDVMVKRANTAGGEDNISVIVVQVEAV